MILIVGKQDERLLESLILSSSRASVVGPARPDWLEMNPSNRPISHHYLRPISILVSISHNWQVMQNVSEDQDRQPVAARKIRADHTLKFIM